jgi:hypothetical protein
MKQSSALLKTLQRYFLIGGYHFSAPDYNVVFMFCKVIFPKLRAGKAP